MNKLKWLFLPIAHKSDCISDDLFLTLNSLILELHFEVVSYQWIVFCECFFILLTVNFLLSNLFKNERESSQHFS